MLCIDINVNIPSLDYITFSGIVGMLNRWDAGRRGRDSPDPSVTERNRNFDTASVGGKLAFTLNSQRENSFCSLLIILRVMGRAF